MDWFNRFAQRHTNRHPHPDWPVGDGIRDFFAVWRRDFERNRVQEHEADGASVEMAGEPPRFPNGHLNTLIAKINARRRAEASAGPDGEYHDIDVARAACRSCPECGGNGITSVPHPDPKRRTVAAFCHCGAGRLSKRIMLEREPKTAARFSQARPDPSTLDYEAVDAYWLTLTDKGRAGWVAVTGEHRPHLARASAHHPAIGRQMLAAAAKVAAYECEVMGIDPFTPAAEAVAP